ncbi:TPA: hypothetical protein DEP58_03485 [Patescibacteria group bacterium]|nr:MAG: hypothetical protein UU98_C0013G0034 [Parcubacteria group bacterium GW2011_GWD2_42_14]HCC05342.1 hypothetical protein [Patescibacteria group bacterium]
MAIPGTQELNTDGQVNVPEDERLFCFCIEELASETYLNDFLTGLNDFLPSYVFDRNTLATHEARVRDGTSTTTPIDRAREFLQRTQAGRAFDSGELGELLLHLFAKEVLGAHKLASKIQSRGDNRTTIPGRDNAYAWMDEEDNVYMLVGEAKLKPNSNDGLREAQGDLNHFWQTARIEHEISLASTHIRSEMTEENLAMYEAFFIDDNEAHQRLRYRNIVFVGYNHNSLQNLRNQTIDDEEFIRLTSEDLQRCLTNQQTLISESPHHGIYCFLPFESVEAARTAFAQINGLVV